MAQFILDTTTISHLERRHPIVTAHFVSHVARDVIGTSTMNSEEALSGWFARIRRCKSNAEHARFSQLLAQTLRVIFRLAIFPMTEPALDRYDQLARQKLNIGSYDLRIAALALELGATVVSNNLRDFGRVPGLLLADWTV